MKTNTIDLIATDPPYNTGRVFDKASGSFQDKWRWDVDENQMKQLEEKHPKTLDTVLFAKRIHGNEMAAFLYFLAVRIIEMHRILKNTGSIYVQCDSTSSHYIKTLMDAVFGRQNFRNEIRWAYNSENVSRKKFARGGDYILFYTKSNKYTFHVHPRQQDINVKESYPLVDDIGRYKLTSCKNTAKRPNMIYEFNGHTRQWRFQKTTMEKYLNDGMLVFNKNGIPSKKTYSHDSLVGGPMSDTWIDIKPMISSVIYPTQKPIELYKRIISASTNENDIVLDPFAGGGTTLIAAEKLKRKWIGIDKWKNGSHRKVIDHIKHECHLSELNDSRPDILSCNGEITYHSSMVQ